jgi:single-stranded-DNA-specific exonuclease
MTAKRWIVRDSEPEKAARLANLLGISPILADLLITRGYDDESSARAFLTPTYEQLYDPYLMLGMRESVARLQRAIDRDESILIYGDYDVDGTTGTAVLLRALKLLGARTGYHVPHRFTEGYGVQQPALERALKAGYKLVVSVDCGIRAHEPLYWARDHGLDVIVTDHHLPDDDEGSPPAFAVLNPNQAGCNYPDKNLAGVGVAFKLVHALYRERGREDQVEAFLKVVAIGTVADVAKLVGENRTIVALGLRDLAKAKNPGLRALIDVAGCGDGKGMKAYDLGFRLGPRINAAGRMDAARAVVELFDTRDHEEAKRLAQHLDSRNEERKAVQQQIFELAISELSEETFSNHVAVVAGEGWHRGVIGIAASKIAERINRPCVVLSIDGDIAHGSARSIEAYHLLNGLTTCSDLFEKFGGHSHAAGVTISTNRIEEFRRRLNDHAASCLTQEDLEPCVLIDQELAAENITYQFAKDLQALEPFGAGNPQPVFCTRNLRLLSDPQVVKEKHLKLRLAGPQNRPLEAIWWNSSDEMGQTPETRSGIEVAYTIELNIWNDEAKIQLNVVDLRSG